MRNIRILMQSNDLKTKEWGDVAEKLGVMILPLPESPIFIPFSLLKLIITMNKPYGLVLRYLNDYPSLFKTLIRCLSELLSVLICKTFRVKIVWICHNVDRETHCYYPVLSRVRRQIIGRASKSILVMDPKLVRHAQKVFPSFADKIDYTTFGPARNLGRNPDMDRHTEGIISFINTHREGTEEKTYVGLSVGHASTKTTHFQATRDLLKKANELALNIIIVIVGPVGEYLSKEDPETLNFLKQDPRIYLVDDYVKVDETRLSAVVDFYWRGYNDLSVPLTIYNAMTVEVPMLVQAHGFLSEAVKKYSLGAVVSNDFIDLDKAISIVENWPKRNAKSFVRNHTWELGSRQILRAFGIGGI